jgi:hypothetical protein
MASIQVVLSPPSQPLPSPDSDSDSNHTLAAKRKREDSLDQPQLNGSSDPTAEDSKILIRDLLDVLKMSVCPFTLHSPSSNNC